MVTKRCAESPRGNLRSGILFTAVILLPVPAVMADVLSTVQLDVTNQLIYNPQMGDAEWAWPSQIAAQVKLQSSGHTNVKSFLQLSANHSTLAAMAAQNDRLLVDKAYMKVRFDNNRLTLGKATLGWGQGTVFNAGDVVMTASPPNSLLTPTSDSRWLASWTHPLGRFSFYEWAILTPNTADTSGNGPDADKGTLAARFQFQIANTQIEGGVAWQGTTSRLLPYLSLQGGKGVNWHISGRVELSEGQTLKRQLITAGLYGMWSDASARSWNYRLETLWDSAGAAQEVTSGTWYQTLVSGELGVSINSRTQVFTQATVSPIDQSSRTTVGTRFSWYQGLSLTAAVTLQQGDSDDTFSSERAGAMGFSTLVSYVF